MNPPPNFLVRPACAGDEERLFLWRNEPWVVRRGTSQRGVGKEEHHAWFQETLARDKRELAIVEIAGVPAGMVRYDFRDEAEAGISIFLIPSFCGKGYGRRVFFSTAPDICVRRGIRRIVAAILADNERSQEFFRRLGFRPVEPSAQSNLRVFQINCATVEHSRTSITEKELSAVAAVLESGHIAKGPKVLELEKQWCQHTNTSHAAVVGSGLGALRLALLALGIGSGDEVLMPAYSCVALMNAVRALDATPVLADVMPDSWTISAEDVRRRLTSRTKAIIAVHLFGAPAAIDALQSFGLPVIEDCAHGIGGLFAGKPFGSIGMLNFASFSATKMLAAGEGGIVAGNDPDLINKIRRSRDYADQPPDGRHLNDKMTDVEAALALTQLSRLPEILGRRAERAHAYDEMLQELKQDGLIELPPATPRRIWYRYVVRLIRHVASAVTAGMASCRVKAEQPVWDLRHATRWDNTLGGSDLAFDRALSLPLYPDLTEFEQRMVCAALRKTLHNE